MSGIKFTIDLLDQATSKIDKTQAHLKSLEKQSEKTAKAIDGIASSLNKASISQKTLVEREAIAKKLAATEKKLTFTKEKLSNIKEKGDLDDLSLLKYKADIKKLSADRAKYNLETIKFKEKLNQEIVRDIKKQENNIKKQEREIAQRVTPISYIANPMGKAIGIVKTKGYSTMPTSIFEQTKIGGNYIPGYKDNYEQILKNNFTKELKTQQKEAEKNTIRMAKEEIRATKERERAAKQEYKYQQERAKYNQKLTESFQKAKVTPINYVADSSGKIIGVASAGRAINANIFESMGMGGGRVPPVPPVPPAGERQSGFLGGRRTFGQVLGGYAAYKTAVGVEGAVSATLGTPIQMENLRASMEAMVFASGNRDKSTLKSASEKHIRFLYDLGQRYGVDFTNVAPEYMKMMSTRAGGKSKFKEQDVKNITESFIALARVNGLTNAETQRTFLAVSQMMGRPTIQGQELNQQLTETMSIARPIIEEAVRRTVEDPTLQSRNPRLYGLYSKYRNKKISLNDLLDEGVIGSGNLIHTLSIVQDLLGDMPDMKSHTFTGALSRLQNAYKGFVDTSANRGGFPKKVASIIDQFAYGLDYVNRVITDPLLSPENTYRQILGANKEDIKITDLATKEERGGEIQSKATAIGYKASGAVGSALLAGMVGKYGLKLLSRLPRLVGANKIGALARLSNPTGVALSSGVLGYELGKAMELNVFDALVGVNEEAFRTRSYYQDKYKNEIIKKNNIDIFNQSENPLNSSYNEILSNSYMPNANQIFKQMQEQLVKAPQQVELILRIEGGNRDFTPRIFTKNGKELNTGNNVIAGGNQSYAY